MENFLLPADIIIDILSRIPVDAFIQCKHVCKTWRALTNDPIVVELHTNRLISDQRSENHSDSVGFGFFLVVEQYGESDDGINQLHFGEYNEELKRFHVTKNINRHHPFKESNYWVIVGSSNGLICLTTPHIFSDDTFVSNPFTGEYVNLPRLSSSTTESCLEGNRLLYIVNGFGYHPSSNEYKVVRICYTDMTASGHVSIYTLGSGRWRRKGEINHSLWSRTSWGILVNGALHWMNKNKEIVSFDLANEEFRIVPSPPPPTYFDELGVLGGCLSVIRKIRTYKRSDIWVMKKDYWIKKFSIPWKGRLAGHNPLALLKSGKILLHCSFKHLITYDPDTESLEMDENFPDLKKLQIIPYHKSFVSLKALGEDACSRGIG